MNYPYKRGFWYGFNVAALIIIALFVFGIPLLHAAAFVLKNVDLSIVETTGTQAFVPTNLEITVSNETESKLNAVEFELSYNPKEVLITNITPHKTLCEERFIITNTINHASGTAFFQCGTITPFDDAQGVIASIEVIPLKSGTTSISFGTSTSVLAHDGMGTDMTRDVFGVLLTSR